ncbi:MAG TPA: pilus assembly protein PilM [Lacipirellulaceae bacterium]|nr:pilus assembly protein PilM [Lacipirellulaceae bacterium]
MEFSRKLGWIGVDVGTHTVKLAQTARDGDGLRLYRAAVIQRPAAWNGDDGLTQQPPITSLPEIKAALECGGFVGRNAICTLPMNICQLRGMNVPAGSDQERRAMASHELTHEWADSKTPMEFDFWELDPPNGEKSNDAFNVNIIAAPRPWVSQLWHDCRQTGLDCWAVDGAPLAMARAVGLVAGRDRTRPALAVDWGYSNTTFAIVCDNRPLYSRRIHNCAFGRVLQAIMQALDVTLDEAQHLADSQGLAAAAGDQGSIDAQIQSAITTAAGETLEELASQLARTLQFAETQRRYLQPACVWLMGGGASLRNVASYLTHALQIQVNVWHMPPDDEPIHCAADHRAAVFGAAAALSASAWRAA